MQTSSLPMRNPSHAVQPRVLTHLSVEALRRLQVPLEERQSPAGQTICLGGTKAKSVFSITSGVVKLVRTLPDGRQRIVRLLYAGDVAGIEALASDSYDNDAVTMTDVSLCRIPADALRLLSLRMPEVQSGLMSKWHQALRGADDWLADLNAGPAGMRVRRFILRMRHATDPTLVTLFSREDMGAMMGLKLETVSREISALAKAGLIQRLDAMGRSYRIVDTERLAAAS